MGRHWTLTCLLHYANLLSIRVLAWGQFATGLGWNYTSVARNNETTWLTRRPQEVSLQMNTATFLESNVFSQRQCHATQARPQRDQRNEQPVDGMVAPHHRIRGCCKECPTSSWTALYQKWNNADRLMAAVAADVDFTCGWFLVSNLLERQVKCGNEMDVALIWVIFVQVIKLPFSSFLQCSYMLHKKNNLWLLNYKILYLGTYKKKLRSGLTEKKRKEINCNSRHQNGY